MKNNSTAIEFPQVEVFSYFEDSLKRDEKKLERGMFTERCAVSIPKTLINYDDVKGLMRIRSRNAMGRFGDRFSRDLWFGERLTLDAEARHVFDRRHSRDDLSDSLFSLRNSMICAAKLRRIICKEDTSFDDLCDVGGPVCLTPYVDQFGAERFTSDFILPIRGGLYSAFIERGFEVTTLDAPHEIRPSGQDEKEAVLTISNGDYENLPFEIRQCCANLLDFLSEVHMHDISTGTKEGIPRQRAHSIASSLWYCLVESFRGGRVAQCANEKCGIPFVAHGERGTKREYCSSACSKAAYRERVRREEASRSDKGAPSKESDIETQR